MFGSFSRRNDPDCRLFFSVTVATKKMSPLHVCCLKDPLLFEVNLIPIWENPNDIHMHIFATHIFIIQKHVVIVVVIAGGQCAAHKMGKGISMIEIGGSHQFQFVRMAAKDVFDVMQVYKINETGGISERTLVGAQNGIMGQIRFA